MTLLDRLVRVAVPEGAQAARYSSTLAVLGRVVTAGQHDEIIRRICGDVRQEHIVAALPASLRAVIGLRPFLLLAPNEER